MQRRSPALDVYKRQTAAVVAHGAVLGKAAGALDEFQIIVALPGQDIFFPDAVHLSLIHI